MEFGFYSLSNGQHQRDLNKEVTGPDFKTTLEIVWRMLEGGTAEVGKLF